MAEPLELNEILQGRKILSVEAGRTPGWMLLNLEVNPKEREAEPDLRLLFLTVFVGGRKGSGEAEHHSTSALHSQLADGGGTVEMIRDGRDPTMPMASACDALANTKVGPENAKSDTSDVKDAVR